MLKILNKFNLNLKIILIFFFVVSGIAGCSIISPKVPVSKRAHVKLQDVFNRHIRWSADNWETIMGESTEQEYDCGDLETAYQKFLEDI